MPSPTARSSAPARFRGVGSRLTARPTPRLVHYVTLFVAFAWICVYARDQWFFFDEWDFLKLSSTDFLAAHNGHWSTAPMLLTQALVRTVGMNSYWPYLVPVILAHVALAHVLWRVMARIGVNLWIATGLALVFALYGAGAEDILWAFQFGFVGAILLGTIALLLTDGLTRATFVRRGALIAALSIVALTFAGTAIPLVAATGFLALRRVGWLRALGLVAVPGVIYLLWYGYAKSQNYSFTPADWQPHTLTQALIDTPLYAGRMIIGALDGLTPVPYLGGAVAVALVVYLFVTIRRQWRSAPIVLALPVAGVLFALMTASVRLNLSAEAATSSRYVYFAFAMLLPLVAVALNDLTTRRRVVLPVVLAGAAALSIFGALGIRTAATEQAVVETRSHMVVSAAISLIEDPSALVRESASVDPVSAPLLTVHDLRELTDAGAITPGQFDQGAYDTAVTNIVLSAETQ
ncbi:hypothetical protein ACEXQE_15935 [Herbiconiux sp. P17]|uniref:hypothetical protein n=1 Tax=Herbiconiux wuyangfengii TaxID=3342794 RepID=UPI0035B9C1BE